MNRHPYRNVLGYYTFDFKTVKSINYHSLMDVYYGTDHEGDHYHNALATKMMKLGFNGKHSHNILMSLFVRKAGASISWVFGFMIMFALVNPVSASPIKIPKIIKEDCYVRQE